MDFKPVQVDGDRPKVRRERRQIDLESPDSLVDQWLLEVNQADFSGKSPDFDLHQPLLDLESSSFEDRIRRFEVEQRMIELELGRLRVEVR